MFNKEAFVQAVIDLPKFIRNRVATRGNMSIASQLDSVVEAIFVMNEVKDYPYASIAELLKEHGLNGVNASNLTQWYRSREKTIALLAECRTKWKKGELKLNGIIVPPDLDKMDSWQPRRDSETCNKEKSEPVDVPTLAESHSQNQEEKEKPAAAKATRPIMERPTEEKPKIDQNLVLEWGTFLKSCRAEYNVTSSEVSAELINRGIINEDKELARTNEYFPDVEPLTKLNWVKVKVKASLATLLFE